MGDDRQMLYGALGHDDSVIEIPVLGLAPRALDEVLHAVLVCGVDSREEKFDRGLRRWIEREDPVCFLGPHDLPARRLPPEAARGTEPLRLRQVCLRLPEMIPFQLDLLAKTSHVLEGAGIGKSDRRLIGKRSEPLELLVIDMVPTEYGEHAQDLALEDQRLTGKCHDSFGARPLWSGNRRVPWEIFCDEHRRPGPADMADLPHVQRNTAEVSGKPGPVCARVVGGLPGARP